jgi:hypothetical protein
MRSRWAIAQPCGYATALQKRCCSLWPRGSFDPSKMTQILILIVLAAIVKLMLVTVFAGMRYRRRRDIEGW